jgi:fatty acid desaturase
MSSNATSAGASADARAALSAGLDGPLAALRRFSLGRRLGELAVFVPLWPAGAAMTLAAWHGLEPGVLCYALITCGVLLSAVALNAFVLLLHEGMHHVLFANPTLNRWVSVLLGAPALISFTAYQVMHLRHHHYLGDPRDPDDYANYTSRPWRLWLMHFCRLLFAAFLYVLLIPLLALRVGTATQRWRIAQEASRSTASPTRATRTWPVARCGRTRSSPSACSTRIITSNTTCSPRCRATICPSCTDGSGRGCRGQCRGGRTWRSCCASSGRR